MKSFYSTKALYIGPSRDGFVKGKKYNVRVDQKAFGRIKVMTTHGFQYWVNPDEAITHSSLAWFIKSWEINDIKEEV